MNNSAHLEEGQLLRYLDGELPRRKARQVREHLEACWQCRSELEELESTVADCVRYRKHVLGACLPPPPQPWRDLTGGFDRIDTSVAGESPWLASGATRLLRASMRRMPSPVKWASAFAATAAIAVMIFHQLRDAPSVQAARLLQRAVAVSESRPPLVRRVRITTRTRQITRMIGAPASVRPAVDEAGLAQRFRAANYNWEDPLSARSYAMWSNHLSAKQDSVSTVEDRQAPGRNTYEIKTTTQDGDLVAATLKLRMTDFEPVEGRFEFRNRDWVEMTEWIDQQTLPARTAAGATGGILRAPGGMPRQPGVPPEFVRAPAARPPAGISSELRVVEALHKLGADLGDPLEISREGRQVLVSGTGIPSKRQEELHAVLDPLPDVVVRFADSAFPASAPPVQSEPAPARDAAGPEHTQLQARIEERLGGRPQFERFSGQLLDWTDSAMARAYAIRRLAQEFPPAAERQMSAADVRRLHSLGREHLAGMSAELARIETTLHPVLMALGAPPPKVQGQEGGADEVVWQPAAEDLLHRARGVESLLAVVLGAAPADTATDNIAARLGAAVAQLTTSIQQCQRLLSYDDVRLSR